MMKNVLFTVLIAVIIPTISLAQSQALYKQTESFIKEKDYFRARDFYQIHKKEMGLDENLVLEAYLDHAFNLPVSSNVSIISFFENYGKQADDSLKLELLRLKQLNHARLFEYARAYETSVQILEEYGDLLSAEDRADYENTAVIWDALKSSPKQEVTITENTVIRMSRDKAKLANLEVKANGVVSDFIFDTGANFSTVTETTAKAFNMTMLSGTIEVAAITGGQVKSNLAICPTFSIGNITIKNAVFLVLPDTAIAFPQIQYQINGIIGFPVIESLKEVQLTREDDFIVPKIQSSATIKNMALEFLTPILDLNGECFTFDTGATATMLYRKYLEKYEKEISINYDETDLQFGGAAGVLKKRGYKINYNPVINGKKLTLTDVHVFRDDLSEDKDFFYGNIGQDVIKQFDKMTLNFSSMFIGFE